MDIKTSGFYKEYTAVDIQAYNSLYVNVSGFERPFPRQYSTRRTNTHASHAIMSGSVRANLVFYHCPFTQDILFINLLIFANCLFRTLVFRMYIFEIEMCYGAMRLARKEKMLQHKRLKFYWIVLQSAFEYHSVLEALLINVSILFFVCLTSCFCFFLLSINQGANFFAFLFQGPLLPLLSFFSSLLSYILCSRLHTTSRSLSCSP